MFDTSREAHLTKLFVTLSDTLTDGFDMIELLDTLVNECVRLFKVDAGGLMLADPTANGALRLVVSTGAAADAVELRQLETGEGPCMDSCATGRAISVADIEADSERWPTFAVSALESGFTSMHAFPLRLRGAVVGAMNLFSVSRGRLSDQDISAGQALADVATIAILQERLTRDRIVLAEQLQGALDSRVVIEQAKGIIAEAEGVDVNEAFDVLRRYARAHGRRLAEVAARVADRTLRLPSDHDPSSDHTVR